MLKVRLVGKPGKGFSALDALVHEGGCPQSPAPLGEWVALLAMKYRRAPLPVPRRLESALMCQGVGGDPSELGDLARRYLLFLGDAQMLLAESKKRPITLANPLQLLNQFGAQRQTQSETGVPPQCL